MTTAERNQPSGVTPQSELAGVLRGLRLAAGYTLEKFSSEADVPILQLRFIEAGTAIPQRGQLHAYLELGNAGARPRAQALKLWSLAHRRHEERRKARRVRSVSDSLTESTVVMALGELPDFKPVLDVGTSSAPVQRQGARPPRTRPDWRRALQVSQADPSLWPRPDDIDTPAKFAESLEAIKKSTGLSYNVLAQATAQTCYPLATSTVHGLCKKPKLPPNVDSVRCFILICGGDEKLQLDWAAAWQRLRQASAQAGSANTTVLVDRALADDAEEARKDLVAVNCAEADIVDRRRAETSSRADGSAHATGDRTGTNTSTAIAGVGASEEANSQQVPSEGAPAVTTVPATSACRGHAPLVLLAFFIGVVVGMVAGALLLGTIV